MRETTLPLALDRENNQQHSYFTLKIDQILHFTQPKS